MCRKECYFQVQAVLTLRDTVFTENQVHIKAMQSEDTAPYVWVFVNNFVNSVHSKTACMSVSLFTVWGFLFMSLAFLILSIRKYTGELIHPLVHSTDVFWSSLCLVLCWARVCVITRPGLSPWGTHLLWRDWGLLYIYRNPSATRGPTDPGVLGGWRAVARDSRIQDLTLQKPLGLPRYTVQASPLSALLFNSVLAVLH